MSTTYSCRAYSWIAPRTGTISLAFQMRHDPSYWYLDDVSVYNRGTQMLINGGFETSSLTNSWTVSTPFGVCGSSGAAITTSSVRSGSFSLRDGSTGCADQVSQTFGIISGEVYTISFWILMGGSGSGISLSVLLL